MGVFRSPLQELYKRVERGGFSGGVSELGSPMPEIPRTNSGRVVTQEVQSGNSDPTKSPNIVARLLHLSPISPALQKKRDKVVANLFPLLTEAEELERELIEYRQRTLESQLLELRARCRKQSGVVDSLKRKLDAAELRLLNAMAESQNEVKLLEGFRDLKASGQHVPRWPTQTEIEAFEIQYADQQAKVVKANERVAATLSSRNELLYQWEPVSKIMEKLIAEEARLKSEVTKQPFIDLELGLESVPAGYTEDYQTLRKGATR
jgi:hypothetical protein